MGPAGSPWLRISGASAGVRPSRASRGLRLAPASSGRDRTAADTLRSPWKTHLFRLMQYRRKFVGAIRRVVNADGLQPGIIQLEQLPAQTAKALRNKLPRMDINVGTLRCCILSERALCPARNAFQ